MFLFHSFDRNEMEDAPPISGGDAELKDWRKDKLETTKGDGAVNYLIG